MGEGVSHVEPDLFETNENGSQDGKPVKRAAAANVERERYRCEINHLVELGRKEGSRGVDRYLGLVTKHRGIESAERLRADARAAFIEATGRKPMGKT